MLGVLTYFQALLGRRGFIVALIIVALAPLVWEYSGAFTGYFNAYIQRQLAAVSEEKAKGEADKAAEDARSAKAAADNAERLRVAEAEERVQLAKKAAADAETARAAADNAARLRLAEANERTELAKKAAADAEAARAAADNAARLRLAEANERTELAKKAAADAETAREVAKVSHEMQAATVAAKEAEARKLDGEATQAQVIACAFDTSKCSPENKRIIAGETSVGGRVFALKTAQQQQLAETSLSTAANPAPANMAAAFEREIQASRKLSGWGDGGNEAPANLVRSLEGSGNLSDPFASGPARRSSAANEAPATAQQLSPECRQHFAEWQGFTSHAAFAVLDDGDCRWNGIGNRLNHRSPAAAVEAMKDYCNKKHLACTIIATK